MASILLAPGEAFEHFHREASFTTLVNGHVRFCEGTVEHVMKEGESIYVAPNRSHTIINFGDVIARVDCVHSHEDRKESNRF